MQNRAQRLCHARPSSFQFDAHVFLGPVEPNPNGLFPGSIAWHKQRHVHAEVHRKIMNHARTHVEFYGVVACVRCQPNQLLGGVLLRCWVIHKSQVLVLFYVYSACVHVCVCSTEASIFKQIPARTARARQHTRTNTRTQTHRTL